MAAFVEGGVEFLLIGGHAVNSYSSKQRTTKDIDLLLNATAANRARAAKARATFGGPPNAVAALRNALATEIVYFGVPPLRVDILQSIPCVDFGEATRDERSCVSTASSFPSSGSKI